MRALLAVVLAFAVLALPATQTSATSSASVHYLVSEAGSHLVIHDAAGLPFRAHDMGGVLRAYGVVTSPHFAATVAGPSASALLVTLGSQGILVQAENDDLWQ